MGDFFMAGVFRFSHKTLGNQVGYGISLISVLPKYRKVLEIPDSANFAVEEGKVINLFHPNFTLQQPLIIFPDSQNEPFSVVEFKTWLKTSIRAKEDPENFFNVVSHLPCYIAEKKELFEKEELELYSRKLT